MALYSITNAHLAFGHVALLDGADFALDAGERVGLIGRNGAGKSSLLRIVAGIAEPDDGQVARQQGLRVSLVAQEPAFDAGATVFEAVAGGLARELALLTEYEALAEHAHDDAALERMSHLQSELDEHDAWSLRSRVQTALSRLSLEESPKVESLSGGQRKRVALARALVAQPDVLVLDEPTNHLDLDGIAWLEELLTGYRGSVLFVTHDRRFLDNVATRIVELDRGRLQSFPGNFTAFQARKAQWLEAEAAENAKFDKLLAQEEAWIRRGVEARRTRDMGRVARLMELRRLREARRDRVGQVNLALDAGERSGKLVAELVGVGKGYAKADGTRIEVVRNFSSRLLRGDKVGLIGPNGAGKTTLLKLILGEIAPDTGTVRRGANLTVAYFDQLREQLREDATVLDTISPGSDWVEVAGQRKHVMSYLNDFLFAPERARSPVASLSGGERNRLLLARLFARPANVMVLDEPTNDLDIDTLELLEELLQGYDGTVFLVSHDRTFLDNVVTQTIAWEGDGLWKEYAGGYEDWRLQSGRGRAARAQDAASAREAGIAQAAVARTGRPAGGNAGNVAEAPANRLSFKERRELDALPGRIAALEEEQKGLLARAADPAFYKSDPAEIRRAKERMAQVEQSLKVALDRWEALEARVG